MPILTNFQHDSSREQRLRRLAKKKCCSIFKSRVRNTHNDNQGLYMLQSWYHGVVEGPHFDATLDQIEGYLSQD